VVRPACVYDITRNTKLTVFMNQKIEVKQLEAAKVGLIKQGTPEE
jgi:hypothetical protein